MSSIVQTSPAPTFRHEAFLYAGEDEFVAGTTAFIADAVEQDEPVFVVVDAHKIALLRDALAADARHVQFADMAKVGHNPARIIPAWREFVDQHGGNGRRLRGIGEPISDERDEAALSECHRHESLLNLAFADSGDWWLLCPYDMATLTPEVIHEAQRTHPFVLQQGVHRSNPSALDLSDIRAPFDEPLAEPPEGTTEFVFDVHGLVAVRVLIRDMARRVGLGELKTADAVLGANEVATNSVRHGGGVGILRLWIEDKAVVCEVRDAGHIDDPLVGRVRPHTNQFGGRGMWLANQLCDLVQLRSSVAGTIVRLHIRG
jgi:anti-sigma regulatory factor (Ser/Thr protein kinase)